MGFDNYVDGIESPDWEQNPSLTNHNVYKGTANPDDYDWGGALPGLSEVHTISAFCSGCHENFHGDMGSSSPWIRHPNDILLPTTGDYAAYDPTVNYSNEVPVAYTDPTTPTRATAVVMCLSCHRAHGSPYPDMLRFDYDGMLTGEGCFVCHTTKDD